MNDALRLLDRMLRPFGYHIKRDIDLKVGGLATLKRKLREADLEDGAVRLGRGRTADASADVDTLVVCLRTCLLERRNVNPRPRLTGASVEETALRCILSLVRSLNHAAAGCDAGQTVRLRVFDDHSDPAPLERLRRVLATAEVPVELVTTAERGQGPSLHEQFTWAREGNAVLYFCEDDWLHEENAVRAMWDFYRHVHERLGTHLVIHPQESERLYQQHYPCYVLLGADRRWRTMQNATHTFLTHAHVVRDFWACFENTRFVGDRKKRRLGSERRTTNRLYHHIPGFSPMPAVAVHLQYEEQMPPFFDWRPLWERNAPGAVVPEMGGAVPAP